MTARWGDPLHRGLLSPPAGRRGEDATRRGPSPIRPPSESRAATAVAWFASGFAAGAVAAVTFTQALTDLGATP